MAKKKPERVWTDAERAIVKRMAMVCIPHDVIAKVLKVRKESLLAAFPDELENSEAEANAAVAGALFKSAMKGNVSAQIFWCKVRLGWREKIDHEIGGKDGQPFQPILNITIAKPD